ncbi:MAG: PIN domain-containing protein [Peptococcaceae bacterium]|nr:PIN domain-containing protein [Peptococcaceae bacterium]
MRILIDTNVIMDFIVKRGSFSDDAETIFNLCMEKREQVCIGAHTITNLFYILRNYLTIEERRDVLLRLCRMFTVVGIDMDKLESALQNTDFKDFEDCLQVECGKDFEADFIITRNKKDFTGSVIPILEPGELIERWQ